jgi:UDP-glucose 4-epimerase
MNTELTGQRVLVTGARGFLGTHLLRQLGQAGAELHGVSRTPPTSTGGVQWWGSDLHDRGDIERLFGQVRPHVVYHMGGHVTASPGIEHVVPTFETLLASTVSVLLSSAQARVKRVVLVGSASESTLSGAEPTPASPYVIAKWAASTYGRMFHSLYGTPVVIVRPVMIYGPGQPPEKLLPTVITALLRGEGPKMSSGLFAPDWVYIDDLTDGLARAGYIPGAEGCSLDLGSGTLTPVREMVGRIVKLVRERRGACPEPLIGALPDRPNEAYDPANTGKAFEKLGWRATTSLDDGLRKTIRALETGLKRQ